KSGSSRSPVMETPPAMGPMWGWAALTPLSMTAMRTPWPVRGFMRESASYLGQLGGRLAVAEIDHLVGDFGESGAMRDDDYGLREQRFPKIAGDDHFGFGIERGGGLVEDQDAGLP